MVINIDSRDLAKACSLACKLIPNKTTIPILSDLLIEAGQGQVKITSTDQEVWMIQSVQAEVKNKGNMPERFCVNASNFTSLLQAIPSQPVEIELKKRRNADSCYVNIKHSTGVSEFPVADANEYPDVKKVDAEVESIPADVLKRSIQTCRFCLHWDLESFPQFAHLMLDFKDGQMTAVGTDKNRLAKYDSTVEHKREQILLPPKSLTLIVSALDEVLKDKDGQNEVLIGLNGDNICFQTDKTIIYCRQTSSRYPNYNSVIPAKNYRDKIAVMNRMDLLSVITRASLFADNQGRIFFLFDPLKNTVTISAEDKEFAKSSEEHLNCSFESPKPLTIAFKYYFLKECLQHLTSEQVRFEMSECNRAVLVFEENGDPNVLMLLMPMLLEL